MARLEDLTKGASVKGILPDQLVTVVDVKWHGSQVVELTYKDTAGRLGNELVYRDKEPSLEIATVGKPWSFDGDGSLLRLVSEAKRINLAYLFDPLLAVHTSILEPLPHQITAVYGEMLTRQPLRFLLADDPGAGKTIMAGLLIKELLIRGDLNRCLICCPANLAEQWQDELYQRFHLDFDIISRETIENSRTGNPYEEKNLIISRLDHMSRNEDILAKLEQTDWDLVVVDEAHKMSASFFSGEVKETKRYKLGKLLGKISRHFLLMTATPHNGKEQDFQLFMSLLDADRFEGRFRDGVHVTDTSDLMRRLVKEKLLKFDGRPLFPERWAYTVAYKLSDLEAKLYAEVTEYVREQMNRAERLAQEGEGRRGNTVGFALTILQRRLASSPEAIYQSLNRRVKRLEDRLREEKILRRGAEIEIELDTTKDLPEFTEDDIEDMDDAPDAEVEQIEDEVIDRASAARTIAELEAEIEELKKLLLLAKQVRQSGTDKKWEELSRLLQDQKEMFDRNGFRQKLVIFTEHKDTLYYLAEKIRNLLGKVETVETIHGGLGREKRKKAQEAFLQDKDVQVLVATDAAGEGINLQRAYLMINYDIPWNPNRIEQRFGRIHRIGQEEVCHLWNLVAEETREGDVFKRLLEKLEQEKKALGGQVFDILGKLFQETRLRDLLIKAIRYGNQEEVRAQLNRIVDEELDRSHLVSLLEEHALAHDAMDVTKVREIKEDMDRAEARRLQPHFVAAFFLEAFRLLGGTVRQREPKRYEISHVPAVIRNRDRLIGSREPVLPKYERITFHKELITMQGKALAEFICPGHPLLDATIDVLLERHRDLLKRGSILIDPNSESEEVRVLYYLEHSIQDARLDKQGNRRIVSREMQFVEMNHDGTIGSAGYAPYLDYRPASSDEISLVRSKVEMSWMEKDLESPILSYAAQNIVPRHFESIKKRKEVLVDKTMVAVKDRLTKEINYWDHRAEELKVKELAGRSTRVNSGKARQRADELEARLHKRMEELEQEKRLSPLPPVVVGGAIIVPQGVLNSLKEGGELKPATFARDTKEVERLAMEVVMKTELNLGRTPNNISGEKRGYDIESRVAEGGRLLFIEVKGRQEGANTVTVTKNEILTALNKPDDFILAIVEVKDSVANEPVYIRQPFQREPDFAVTSINYNLSELLTKAQSPT